MLSKILLLTGSGEFTDEMKYVDSYVLSFADQSKRKTAVIPTAGGKELDYEKWIKKAQEHFANYGYEAFGVPVLNREDADNKEIVDQVKDAAMIYFSGGDPGYLWHSVKDTYLIKTVMSLYNEGVILAGSSAGAWMLGSKVLINANGMLEGEATPVWEDALGLVKYTIIPHYDRVTTIDKVVFDRVYAQTPEDIKNSLLGIDENTSLLLTDDTEGMVLGKSGVHIFKDGTHSEYKSGSFFTLH